MDAMGKRSHKGIAALLCACLLVLQAMPCYAAAQESVTASTDVKVLAVAGFQVVEHTPDFAATADEAKAFELVAKVAGGAGPYSWSWSRTVDGAPDGSFSDEATTGDNAFAHPLAADALEDGCEYAYTITVTDSAGKTATATVSVVVSNEYSYRTVSDADVSVTGYLHDRAVLSAEPLDSSSPTYSHLQQAAGGWRVAGAWHAEAAGAPDGKRALVGPALVELPTPGVPDGGAVRVVGLDASGAIATYEAVVSGGEVSFTAPALGAFAVAYEVADGKGYTIEAFAGEGGQIAPHGTATFADGASQTYTVLPDSGYAVDRVLVDGQPTALTGNYYTFDAIGADHTIRVEFEQIEADESVLHRLGASVDGGHGRVAVDGSEAAESVEATLAHGEPALVEFVPDAGYALDSVTLNGRPIVVLGSAFLVSAMVEDVEVEATFKAGIAPPLPVHRIEAQVAGQGGSVSPEGADVPHGGAASFAFVPDEGYRLGEVRLNGEAVTHKVAQGDGATLALENVVADHSITASFERTDDPGPGPDPDDPFVSVNVTVEVGVDGTEGGAVSPSGSLIVEYGASQTFFVYPEVGYDLDQVLADGEPVAVSPLSAPTLFSARTSVGSGGGYRFAVDPVTRDTVVKVTFKKLADGSPAPDPVAVHAVSATASPGGAISPSGETLVPHGESLSFALKPDAGYRLASLSVNGADVTDRVAGSTYVLEDVAGYTLVEAVFEPEGIDPGPGPDPGPDPRPDPGTDPDPGADSDPDSQVGFFEIAVTAVGRGSVSDLGGAPSGSVKVAEGSDKRFSFLPEAGYAVSSVKVDGMPVAASSGYTFYDVRSDHALEVSFAAQAAPAPAGPAQAFGRFAQTGDSLYGLMVLFAAIAAGLVAVVVRCFLGSERSWRR